MFVVSKEGRELGVEVKKDSEGFQSQKPVLSY